MLSRYLPVWVCPHPATQHLCHLERPGSVGMQMGSFSSLNVMGVSNSSREISLSMLRLWKSLCRIMLVTPFISSDGLLKLFVPSTTLSSVGLVAENQRRRNRRGRKVTRCTESAVSENPISHIAVGAFCICPTGAVAQMWAFEKGREGGWNSHCGRP